MNETNEFEGLTEAQIHVAKVIMVTLYHINELKQKGMIKGGMYNITETGLKKAEKFMTEGFNPTEDEMLDVINYMNSKAEKI